MVWNFVTGCTRVSEGCEHCYAERIARRFWKGRKFSDVRIHPERLGEPSHWRKPRRVFVCSMSDLFHDKVPFTFIGRAFRKMDFCEQHIFQILTKRIDRAAQFCSRNNLLYHMGLPVLPQNVWLGVSCENQKWANKRIPKLLQIPAAVRFVSLEPLLGPVDLTDIHPKIGLSQDVITDQTADAENFNIIYKKHLKEPYIPDPVLGWVIVGGESGPGARPMDPDWARSIRDQCRDAAVPFFMKQMGGFPNKRDKIEDFPVDLRIREYPQ